MSSAKKSKPSRTAAGEKTSKKTVKKTAAKKAGTSEKRVAKAAAKKAGTRTAAKKTAKKAAAKKAAAKKAAGTKTAAKKRAAKPSASKRKAGTKALPKKKTTTRVVEQAGGRDTASGNVWVGASGGTQDDIATVESALGLKVPPNLADLLMASAGGHPANDFFDDPDSEVFELTIGYLLPLRDGGKKRGIAATTLGYRRTHGLVPNLLPFALDSGHANLLCMRLPQRDIVYWLHDQPSTVKFVAESLERLLAGLEPCPF